MMAFFNYDRKRWALEDIKTCYACADKAGIKDKLFVNFGLLLGVVREYDFIGHDDDVDMCVDMTGVPKASLDQYVRNLDAEGMFFARKKMSKRTDNNCVTWFTLRKRQGRAKFCHWCGFEWQGFWWWSKAGKWVTARKFDLDRWGYNEATTEGIMLGIPAEYIREKIWVPFRDMKVLIPKLFGSVLDWEYPGWPVPKKGGSSKKQAVCIVQKWEDQRTWKVKLG